MSLLFSMGCKSLAGAKAATCASSTAGVRETGPNRKNAAEIVALAPDVIFAHGSSIMTPLLQLTQDIPIVFVSVSDPIAGGFVGSLAKPGGNATGFTSIDYSMAGKWLELLKQFTPEVVRVAVIRDPRQVSGAGQLGAVQAVAPLLGVEVIPLGVKDAAEIEQGSAPSRASRMAA